ETFPPLRRMRAELAPLAEWHVRADVAGGALVLDGRIDLALGRPAPDGPGRMLIDLKADGARPEHVEDLRFYALLHGLRLGVAPSRVASVFLASGEWQAEDVTAEVLRHAAERVLGAVAATAALDSGAAPTLTSGRHCALCPRARPCR